MVDTFTTLGFQHDLHSTTNVQTVLSKLPTTCRLEWNRYNLQCTIRQPSLIDLTNWFNIYTEVCSDLPSNSNNNNNTRNSSSSNNYNSSNTQGSSSNGHTHQHGPSDHRANQNNRNQQPSQQQHKSGQKDQRRDFCPENRNEPKGQITAIQGPTTMFQLPQPPQVRRLSINANLLDGRMQ